MFELNRQNLAKHPVFQPQQETSQGFALPPNDPPNEKIAAFHESDAYIRALFGGNRSGKTEAGFIELLKACEVPGTCVWACTVSNEMVGEFLWEKAQKYLSKEIIKSIAWTSKVKHIPSLISLQNGSEIWFKSYERGREKFQGASVQRILLDEEPPEDIMTECLARVVDTGGDILLTMTPMKGLTWVYDRIYCSDNADIVHWTVSILENKYISQEEKDRFVAMLSQDEIARRVYGQFMMLSGAVWKEFNPERNIISRFPIPNEWPKIRVIDFGYKNPFCCLWMAYSPSDETIYIYQEHYQKETLLEEHAKIILGRDNESLLRPEGYYEILATVADHDAQARAEFEGYGIDTEPAMKDIDIGIQVVNRLFKYRADGKPSLYIFGDLENTIRECRKYHYRETRLTGKEEPEKKDDHTQDCLRYGCMYFDELYSVAEVLPPLSLEGDEMIYKI